MDSEFDNIENKPPQIVNFSKYRPPAEQQRISIARAVAPKPKFLLFDEPTSALDPEYTVEVLDIINELKKDGIDFIIVTHEMGFARHACEKVAFLADGSLLEFGESEEVFKSPKNLKFIGASTSYLLSPVI